jgi:hypothetical protein
MQVLLAAMLVNADHAALEDREVALDGLGVGIAAHPFLLAMIDSFVARETSPDRAVHMRLIGTEMAGSIGVVENDLADLASGEVSTLTERALPPRSTRVTIFRLSP